MLHIVSYCAIVTLSLRRAVFTIFVFKKFHDLAMGVKGHSRSLRVVSFDRLSGFLLVFFCNFVPKTHRFWDIRLGNIQWPWKLKPGFSVTPLTIKKKMKEDFWLLKWGVTEICWAFDGIRKSPMTASNNNWTNKRQSSAPSDIKSWHCLSISAACRTIDY